METERAGGLAQMGGGAAHCSSVCVLTAVRGELVAGRDTRETLTITAGE